MPAQQGRAVATRERILDATMATVRDYGIPGTTTVAVCERAELARGTLLHHFPTRETLIAAALERGSAQAIEALRATRVEQPPDTDPIEAGVRSMWAMVDGPAFAIWLELVVAARADPRLRETVKDLSARFLAAGDEVLGLGTAMTHMAFATVNGFMLDRVLGLNREWTEEALATLPTALRAAAAEAAGRQQSENRAAAQRVGST